MKGHPRNGCLPNALTDAKAPIHLIDDDAQEHLNMQMQDSPIMNGIAKPIMPGAFGGRPSEISLATDPSPAKSLRERIGTKMEGEDGALPRVGGWLQETQHVRRQSAPAPVFAVPLPARAGSHFGSGSSSSSSTSIAPNHSISQRHIQRDRTKSDVANAFPARRLSRLGSIVSGADLIARNNEPHDDDFEYENPGLEDDDENGDPSDGSTVNGASSVSSYYASESDAGTFSSSGRSSSISFGALVRGSGAAPLMTAYEIGAKYVPFMRDRAQRAGFKVQVLPGPDDDAMDSRDPNSMSSREPGMVRIMISRGDGMKDIINADSKRAKWAGNAGNDHYGLSEPRRRRPREQDDMYAGFNPAFPPQTPRHLTNPHALGMNPQTPDFMLHPIPGYAHTPPTPYPAAVVPHPPPARSGFMSACMLFFVIVLAVVVGAVITIFVLDRLSVSE